MKPKRPQWTPVVTALIRKKGEVLLGRRPEEGSLAGQWEFPGGKIELGESPREALKRELSEELGIEAEIGELRIANTHSYSDRGVLLLFYDVEFWKGEPKSKHHSELKWVVPTMLRKLDIPDANKKILDDLLAVLSDSPATGAVLRK
jgi:8-oxo-dGTP diphosphatase